MEVHQLSRTALLEPYLSSTSALPEPRVRVLCLVPSMDVVSSMFLIKHKDRDVCQEGKVDEVADWVGDKPTVKPVHETLEDT